MSELYTDVQFFSHEEETELVRRAQTGDIEARNRIIMSFYPLLRREARWFAKRSGVPVEDWVHHAITQIIRRFGNFDPSRGLRASTYFVDVGRKWMLRIQGEERLVRLPVFVFDKKSLARSRAEVRTKSRATAQSASCRGKNGRESGDLLSDKKPNNPDAGIRKSEFLAEFHERLKQLPDKDQDLVKLWLRGARNIEIAKAYGVTRACVDLWMAEIVEQLRGVMRGLDFDFR